MATDRVLIEIVTAANMAGIEQAKTGMFGLNASTLALTAALGVLVFAGKSAIENTEKQEKAHASLKQATDVSHRSFADLQKDFDTWAETNKRYIPDQYAAEEALAAFVRAGASAPEAMRELDDALDLATLKSMDMATAQDVIIRALAGNARGLKTLGITSAEYAAIYDSKVLTAEQKHAALLALIETKTKDGRKAQSELSQSTQGLNKDWQDMSTKIGPPLMGFLTFIVDKADQLVSALAALGANKDWNRFLSIGFNELQTVLIGTVRYFEQLARDVGWFGSEVWAAYNAVGALTTRLGNLGSAVSDVPVLGGFLRGFLPGLAGGGQADPYSAHIVGEHGSEVLVMGSTGGTVIPHGGSMAGGQQIHIHIDRGAFIDGPSLDQLSHRLASRLRQATGY